MAYRAILLVLLLLGLTLAVLGWVKGGAEPVRSISVPVAVPGGSK